MDEWMNELMDGRYDAPATRIARRGGLELMNSMVGGAWIRGAPMMAVDELASAGS
jgi:hypothetical protein